LGAEAASDVATAGVAAGTIALGAGMTGFSVAASNTAVGCGSGFN
jgi:hypothetical protein